MLLNVGVYSGSGVDEDSYQGCLQYFGKICVPVVVISLQKENIVAGDLARLQVFMMPGGRDQPYAHDLAGRANQMIQEFVINGGLYIGICAGGYYAGKSICFAKATPLEIIEDRELGFYPDVIEGPYLNPYAYDSDQGARMAKVRGGAYSFSCYYNGGPSFKNAHNLDNVLVKAHYDYEGLRDPAVVVCKVGKGSVLLSGLHFEIERPGAHPRDENNKNLFFRELMHSCLLGKIV